MKDPEIRVRRAKGIRPDRKGGAALLWWAAESPAVMKLAVVALVLSLGGLVLHRPAVPGMERLPPYTALHSGSLQPVLSTIRVRAANNAYSSLYFVEGVDLDAGGRDAPRDSSGRTSAGWAASASGGRGSAQAAVSAHGFKGAVSETFSEKREDPSAAQFNLESFLSGMASASGGSGGRGNRAGRGGGRGRGGPRASSDGIGDFEQGGPLGSIGVRSADGRLLREGIPWKTGPRSPGGSLKAKGASSGAYGREVLLAGLPGSKLGGTGAQQDGTGALASVSRLLNNLNPLRKDQLSGVPGLPGSGTPGSGVPNIPGSLPKDGPGSGSGGSGPTAKAQGLPSGILPQGGPGFIGSGLPVFGAAPQVGSAQPLGILPSDLGGSTGVYTDPSIFKRTRPVGPPSSPGRCAGLGQVVAMTSAQINADVAMAQLKFQSHKATLALSAASAAEKAVHASDMYEQVESRGMIPQAAIPCEASSGGGLPNLIAIGLGTTPLPEELEAPFQTAGDATPWQTEASASFDLRENAANLVEAVRSFMEGAYALALVGTTAALTAAIALLTSATALLSVVIGFFTQAQILHQQILTLYAQAIQGRVYVKTGEMDLAYAQRPQVNRGRAFVEEPSAGTSLEVQTEAMIQAKFWGEGEAPQLTRGIRTPPPQGGPIPGNADCNTLLDPWAVKACEDNKKNQSLTCGTCQEPQAGVCVAVDKKQGNNCTGNNICQNGGCVPIEQVAQQGGCQIDFSVPGAMCLGGKIADGIKDVAGKLNPF